MLFFFKVNISQNFYGCMVLFRLFYLITKFLCLEITCRIIVKCCCELQAAAQKKTHRVRGKSSEL